MECVLCRRTYIPVIEGNNGLDSVAICRDCKPFVFVDDNDTSLTTRNPSRRQSRRMSMYGSSESLETVFSQLIGLARHSRELQPDDDTAIAAHRRSRYRSLSRQARRTQSDTDNDSIGHVDSLFGEGDSHSHFNFGSYGGESDASFDVRSILEMEPISPLDNESHTLTDTDIDPMHAGLDHWVSDDQDEFGVEELSIRHASNQLVDPHTQTWDTYSPNGSTSSPQNGAWMQWPAGQVDLFTDNETDASPFTGTSGDYIDAQGFEELLEHLADAESSRRGAPPAAASSIDSLPCVIISKGHESNGPLFCAVCKDPLSIDTEARKLPCSHLYHPTCIIPWLRTRNSCPVCRYELRTDEVKREEGQRNGPSNEVHETQQQEVDDEGYSNEASEMGLEEATEHNTWEGDGTDLDSGGQFAGSSNHEGGRGWILMSAVPILSIFGIAIAIWFRSSMSGERIRCVGHHSNGPLGTKNRESRSRRWWFPF
ncbi:hypothetical protein HPP92_014356 [Vanilla planifolia]|uniref:RING-type E3 ubiquitin transferase n=1 Tax=Vanilla planifolia TaxID=51239 RepID=A0A835QQ41_VANPL|nr:hypothetical protein HPP92_014356 [Vanilla planifolia]